MATKCPLQPIPQPPTHLFGLLGNIPDIEITAKSTSYSQLAALYGPIYKLNLISKDITILSSHELVNEVFDDTRFEKKLGTLREVRHAAGDGLITALTSEPNWKLAHNLLLAPLGPVAIRAMFPKMIDIVSQLVLKWDRLGPTLIHDATDNFTRLSFDTIALCAFDYRCNSFYGDTPHPFVSSMTEMLEEANRRFNRAGLENKLRVWSQRRFNRDIATMHGIVDKIIADRRQNPQEHDDVLNSLLNARDKETGEGLSDENIRYQVLTLLAAGHETTSGLLSFTIYLLLKNPNELQKAMAEVDTVLGNDALTIRHLPQLKYVKAVLKESLRLHPPAGQVVVHSKEDSGVLGCKYAYTSDDLFVINLNDMHKDPKVWGSDAEAFKPERMLDGSFEKLPPNSWKPWGNGQRECIGREFAMQEAIMTVALILQRFHLEMADPSYTLKISQTITQKPLGFAIKVKRREGKGSMIGLQAQEPQSRLYVPKLTGLGSEAPQDTGPSRPAVGTDNGLPTPSPLSHAPSKDHAPTSQASALKTSWEDGNTQGQAPVAILYGSNSGTCKSFAEDVRSSLPTFGFACHASQTLDAATGNLPRDRPVVIIAPSYGGLPSDDSKEFVSWLKAHAGDSKALERVSYSVCGFGNSDWADTFHRIPKLIDDLMQKQGAQRFAPLGLVDVAGDVYDTFEDWWKELMQALMGTQNRGAGAGPVERPLLVHADSGLSELGVLRAERALNGGEKMKLGTVLANKQLAGDEIGLAKRHMEIALPEGMNYSPGDYLLVQPSNCRSTILRVLNRSILPADAAAVLEESSESSMSRNPLHPYEVVAHRVELNTPASRKQIDTLSSLTTNPEEALLLKTLATSTFSSQILKTRTTLLDLLEAFPSCALPLSTYLTMLPPLLPRPYSISSSPLSRLGPSTATITYDVLRAPGLSDPNRIHLGVASNHLSQLDPGAPVRCTTRKASNGFRLPADPATPLILIAVGSGIAPMRAFVQHRAALAAAGTTRLGKAILYFGCRDPDYDYLYREELELWQQMGVVDVRACFSRRPEEARGFRYVTERVWAESGELRGLWRGGAVVLVCGGRGLAEGVAEVGARVWAEENGEGVEGGKEWVAGVKERGGRFVCDVFG